jgi:hypothetical protein
MAAPEAAPADNLRALLGVILDRAVAYDKANHVRSKSGVRTEGICVSLYMCLFIYVISEAAHSGRHDLLTVSAAASLCCA